MVTWNIEWFPGHKPKFTHEEKAAHIAAVQDALAEIDPDILLLQEVRDLGRRSRASGDRQPLPIFSIFLEGHGGLSPSHFSREGAHWVGKSRASGDRQPLPIFSIYPVGHGDPPPSHFSRKGAP